MVTHLTALFAIGFLKLNSHTSTGECVDSSLLLKHLAQLNMLLNANSIISNLTLVDSCRMYIRFNFNNIELISALQQLSINDLQLTLGNKTHALHVMLDISAIPINHNYSACLNESGIAFCYKKWSDHELVLSHINSEAIRNAIEPSQVCVQFQIRDELYGDMSNLIQLTCRNKPACLLNKKSNSGHPNDSHHEEHKFMYKPSFIVIMYTLCACILVPIAIISKYFIKNGTQRKISIVSEANKKNALISKPSMVELNGNLFAFRRTVVACGEAGHVSNIDEANHILDDKPWINMSYESGLSRAHGPNEFSDEEPVDERKKVTTNDLRCRLEQSNGNIDQLQPLLRKSTSVSSKLVNKNVLMIYESNV